MEQQTVGASILAKFQQISNEKELARNASETIKPFGCCTSSDSEKINESLKRKTEVSNRKPKSENSDYYIHPGLSEKDVGVTEYVSKTAQGFTGILKHRFSDFQVHEIDLDGNVVELKCTELPQLPEEIDTKAESEHKSVLSEDVWKQIDEVVNSKSVDACTEIDVTDKDKAERTLIHKAIKFVYGPKLFSNTVTEVDKTILKVGKCKNKERTSWPANQGPFLHFTVFKENMDTTNVVSLIGQKLRIKANSISYSGTKDKRGKTTQRMCIKRRRAEDLHRLKLFHITLGDYCYKHDCLRLGCLSGNKFTIAIRNVETPDSEIEHSLNLLKENGFFNYYGLQRFGSSSISPTFMVGKAILLKDWQKAIESILKPRNGEKCSPQIRKARETWWSTKNAGLAIKCLPRNDGSIEGKILRALLKTKGTDQYCNALFAIPRNTMLLYVHAYQSLIWNKVVSRRIKEYGLKPLTGDLVFDGSTEILEDDIHNDQDGGDGEDDGDEYGNENTKENEDITKDEKSGKTRAKLKVKKLTSEEVGQVKFDEIVLPLPGHDVEYPDNITAEWYTEFLAEDGLSLEYFKNANAAFALFGTYRKIIGRAEELTWKIIYYSSFDDDLILSDLDKLSNKSLPEQPEDSQYKAVILDFKLKPSQYATMLLREIMKCETAVCYHATLTKNSHTNKDEPEEKKLKKE